MHARQAYIERTGGPEVIAWRDIELPPPGPGQVLLRHEAVGLNYLDTYFRSGLYPTALPATLGNEAAGIVEDVGDSVEGVAAGDRVATFGPSRAAYGTAQIVSAAELFVLPPSIDSKTAAAILLKGLTVEMLTDRVAPLAPGDWAFVPAAAGGVGQLLVQWLTAHGVRVIGTASTEAKCARARELGAEATFLADTPDLGQHVRAATGGIGVRACYDGVGASTWETSLKACGRRATIASFGNASGPVTGVNLGTLAQHGSLFVSRPTLFDYCSEPAERAAAAEKLWAMVAGGKLTVEIGQTYALEDAAQAHRDLEARRTTGSTVLLP